MRGCKRSAGGNGTADEIIDWRIAAVLLHRLPGLGALNSGRAYPTLRICKSIQAILIIDLLISFIIKIIAFFILILKESIMLFISLFRSLNFLVLVIFDFFLNRHLLYYINLCLLGSFFY